MKVIIAGSRDIIDYELVVKGIKDSCFRITEVVSGGYYRGADALGERWARENCLGIALFSAEWDVHGRAAGPIRNEKMAKYADALIAFHHNNSRGTADMIRRAYKYKLKVYVVNVDELVV